MGPQRRDLATKQPSSAGTGSDRCWILCLFLGLVFSAFQAHRTLPLSLQTQAWPWLSAIVGSKCFTIPVRSALPTILKDGFSKHLLDYALSQPFLQGTEWYRGFAIGPGLQDWQGAGGFPMGRVHLVVKSTRTFSYLVQDKKEESNDCFCSSHRFVLFEENSFRE